MTRALPRLAPRSTGILARRAAVRLIAGVVASALVAGLSFPGSGATLSMRDLKRALAACERGSSALAAGNLDAARRRFEEATRIAPDFPDAHLGLGHVLMREGRYPEALDRYQEARDDFSRM